MTSVMEKGRHYVGFILTKTKRYPVSSSNVLEVVLRRDQQVVTSVLVVVIVACWLYLVAGAGTSMYPVTWTPGYALLMFSMWLAASPAHHLVDVVASLGLLASSATNSLVIGTPLAVLPCVFFAIVIAPLREDRSTKPPRLTRSVARSRAGERAGRSMLLRSPRYAPAARAGLGGPERMRTARTVDGHHWRPPCAVGISSRFSRRAISPRLTPCAARSGCELPRREGLSASGRTSPLAAAGSEAPLGARRGSARVPGPGSAARPTRS